jgi:hypothetical protein
MGFDAGDQQRAYMHPYTMHTEELKSLEVKSNVGVPGLWMYQISGTDILGPGCKALPDESDTSM